MNTTDDDTSSFKSNTLTDVDGENNTPAVTVTSEAVARQVKAATDPLTKQCDLIKDFRQNRLRRKEEANNPLQASLRPSLSRLTLVKNNSKFWIGSFSSLFSKFVLAFKMEENLRGECEISGAIKQWYYMNHLSVLYHIGESIPNLFPCCLLILHKKIVESQFSIFMFESFKRWYCGPFCKDIMFKMNGKN